jgi:hypothetical protein
MSKILDYEGTVDIYSTGEWEPILLEELSGKRNQRLADNLLSVLLTAKAQHESDSDRWHGRLHILVEADEASD